MVFLWNAPENIATEHLPWCDTSLVDAGLHPELAIVAPDMVGDTHLKAQATVVGLGSAWDDSWIDLTAQDVARIHGNPLPGRPSQHT